MLEKDFGITPETHHKLIERFDLEIKNYKQESDQKLSSISDKTQEELERLRKEIESRNFDIQMLKQKHLVDVERVKQECAEAMDIKYQGQIAQQFRKNDEEKQQLQQEIRELENEAGDSLKIKR